MLGPGSSGTTAGEEGREVIALDIAFDVSNWYENQRDEVSEQPVKQNKDKEKERERIKEANLWCL